MKSPIKYAGGKSFLAKRLEKVIAEVKPKTVSEPFCGGLSFSLHYQFERVIANDINVPVINFFQQLQKGLIYNHDQYKLGEEHFYSIRNELNKMITGGIVDHQKAAKLFYYYNQQCYNGLMRMNSKGEVNVPIGDQKVVHPSSGFNDFKRVAKDWSIQKGCYSSAVQLPSDLKFVDPPYANNFNNYSGKGFDNTEQIKLLDLLAASDEPIIYCNNAVPALARECKRRGFQIYKMLVPRYINCKGGGRKPAMELLAFKGFGKSRKFNSLVEGAVRYRV